MKHFLTSFLLVVLSFNIHAQSNTTDRGTAMLKKFYGAYIPASSAEDGNLEAMEAKLVALRSKYLTPACQKQFRVLGGQTDADPIIQAQDSYIGLLKTLVITKDPKKENRYAVSYTDVEGSKTKTTIHITLTTQNSILKIAALE